jgi:hypothetical protein
MRIALSETSPRHPRREQYVRYYGAALGTLAERYGDFGALEEADAVLGAEAEQRADNGPIRGLIQYGLDRMAQLRAERLPSVAASEALLRARLRLVPADGAEAGLAWGGLGNALRARYQETGDEADLAEAERTLRRAVELVPADRPEHAVLLANLSGVRYMVYERTGDEDAHSEAVRAGRRAAEIGASDTALRALNNLASNLLMRHTQTGDSRALAEAVDVLERAVAATPDGNPDRAGRLNNLGEALFLSFRRSGDLATLDRSISLCREAIAAAADRDPLRPGMLSRLGIRLQQRHQHRPDSATIEEAAAVSRQAVAATPTADPDRPTFVATTVMVLRDLYLSTRRPAVLAEAAELARAGLRDVPPRHGAREGLLMALAGVLSCQYYDAGDRAAGREARTLLLAASLADGPPLNRITLPRLAALVSIAERNWADAADALAGAVASLPLLASRRLQRADQEHQLDSVAGLVQDACACALQAGDPVRALSLLEHGRGILFAQALENRDDVNELHAQHPDLAARFEQVRADLAAQRTDSIVAADGREADEQHDLARRWDRLTAEIRALPGFEQFLLPPPADRLLESARYGPVVVFSIGDIRSDALIVTLGGVEVVPLPDATPSVVRQRAVEFLSILDRDDPIPGAAPDVARTLEWLWDTVTAPVLDHLGFAKKPTADSGSWPRIWWCPTGALSFLPLHAAGYHQTTQEPAARTVLDRVVSSYTPTLKSLLYARRPRTAAGPARGSGADSHDWDHERVPALVVSIPGTAGAADLPRATAETELLRSQLPRHPTVLGPPDACRGRVLTELTRHSWVHFACHGHTDPADPSASYLLLPDHHTEPLTVLDISRLHLDRADLAYLSACSTARVGTRVTDEAIHLASAFQLAGYRHVIATSWPIADWPAMRFATKAYETIIAHGTEATALATHAATHALRHRYRNHPHVWAAHIHTGA